MENKTIAIVVTYNRLNLLNECIAALNSQKYDGFDIMIVNNCSTDGTEEFLSQFEKNNRFIIRKTDKNVGGAGGFSFGLKEAYALGYEKYWLMDDDTIPDDNALDELEKADDYLKQDYGFLSSYVRWIDGKSCLMNNHAIAGNWMEEPRELIERGYYLNNGGSFVSFFTHRKILENVGLPYKEFFIWGDDAEYSARIANGYKGYFVLNSTVTHKIHSNIPTDIYKDSADRLFRYQLKTRNELFLARKEGKKVARKYVTATLKGCFWIVVKVKDKPFLRVKYVLKGLNEGRKFNPQIEYVK